MGVRKIMLFLSCAAAAACLTAGAGSAWRGTALGFYTLLALVWLIKPVRRLAWLPSVELGGYLIAAAFALLAGGSPGWLLSGGCAALIGWDLILFSRSRERGLDTGPVHRCEQEHLKALGIGAGISLALIAAGLVAQVRLPFWLMLAALAGGLLGLLLVWRRLQKKNTP